MFFFCAKPVYCLADTGFLISIILGTAEALAVLQLRKNKIKPENCISVTYFALLNYSFSELILHLNHGQSDYWFTCMFKLVAVSQFL